MNLKVLILSFIVASRFFSLFIVLPVISLYSQQLEGASTLTAGLIVGIYAIFQMLFSLPFGLLSDVTSRRASMILGLIIFIIGSIICAFASHIDTMLIGRSLQGMGAIGGVAIAMIADSTSDEQRAKAMAIMGGCIGMSFALAMIIGPALAHFAGLASLFYLSVGLSVLAIILLFCIPNPKPNSKQRIAKTDLKRIVASKNLAILYLTNLLQKGIMAAFFTFIPLAFVNHFQQVSSNLYKLYAAAMLLGFFAMGAGGVIGESKGKSKLILLAGVALFICSSILFEYSSLSAFYAGVGLFFIGFCLHEPIMQSSLSKICPISLKGSVLGLSNACGYLGSFLGPIICATCLHHGLLSEFLLAAAALCALWFLLLLKLENPNDFKIVHLGWVDTSALNAIDRGRDAQGDWVKINIKKYPIERICDILGVQASGASVNLKKDHS